MVEIIFYVLIFLIGIYFGSFFTLCTYRIPKGENITYKHSYCPNCNHKLGLIDLIPLFSYIFLGGKCRYCKQKIRIRYFLLEAFTAIVFVLFAMSLKINFSIIDTNNLIYFILGILYFSSLFIISGIDKEKHNIQKSVLIYGIIVSIIYMIYSYTLNPSNVYKYVIYLLIMLILLITDTTLLKKNLKYNYIIQLLILTIYMIIFSGEYITIMTIVLVILSIGIKNVITKLNKSKSMVISKKNKVKKPIGFFMCISNVIIIIITNFTINYMIK